MVRSNCIASAVSEYRRRLRTGEEAYIVIRASRLQPHWIPHVGVGRMQPCGHIAVESFKPLDTSPIPWWLVWRALSFEGRWVEGDSLRSEDHP
jgi:hypothetical protein